MITFHVISLFPETVEPYVKSSILGRAQEKKLIQVKYYNPRDFFSNKKTLNQNLSSYQDRRVDGRPYGGGPGMVIEALPIIRAIEKAVGRKLKITKSSKVKAKDNFVKKVSKVKILFFSPAGKSFSNNIAENYSKFSDIVLVCGRYEGVDARIAKVFPMEMVSIGDFVLTGGEIPAMTVIDAITRRIPGVLGHIESIEESRVSSPLVYTRPEVLVYKGKKYKVPKILLSGHHLNIEEWKTKKRGK